MNPEPTIDAMRTAAAALKSGDTREQLRAVQVAQDALDAAKAVLLAQLKETREFEDDGASTLNMWARTQLRLNAGQATALVKCMTALRDLPAVGEAAAAGRISAAHVRVFVYGLAHVGLDLMRDHEDRLVALAEGNEPAEVVKEIRDIHARNYPQDLDDAYQAGMDKEDFAVDALLEGWHVSGFLNTLTGAKLKKVLEAISAPRDADDVRTGAQRRVQGLDDLLSDILGNGMPTDKGVKPHMSVYVDAETLEAAAEHVKATTEEPHLVPDPMPETEPAVLAGHGPIGPQLLMFLFCLSTVTGFVMRQSKVLNLGRAKYSPNLKQRQSVLARQRGQCATPGCNHTHLEIHHVVWWSLGGPTDLDLLIGLCTRCHHLVHRNLLHITGNATDGFIFTNRHRKRLRRRRTGYRRAA